MMVDWDLVSGMADDTDCYVLQDEQDCGGGASQMGDMADMALDDAIFFEELRSDYHRGILPKEEAYQNGIIDELGYEAGPYTGHPRTVTCKYCGQRGLIWGNPNGEGWRLYDYGVIHNCKAYKEKNCHDKDTT